MILCSFSRKSFFSCFSGNGNGNGRESGLLFGNKWELEYSLRFPKAGNGNGNDVIGMGIHESHSRTSLLQCVSGVQFTNVLQIFSLTFYL